MGHPSGDMSDRSYLLFIMVSSLFVTMFCLVLCCFTISFFFVEEEIGKSCTVVNVSVKINGVWKFFLLDPSLSMWTMITTTLTTHSSHHL